MKTAERMRRDGWIDVKAMIVTSWGVEPVIQWWRRCSGIGIAIMDNRQRKDLPSDYKAHGIRDLAQRAKSAARKLARRKR